MFASMIGTKANCPISFLWTIRYKSISFLGYCVKVLGKRSCKKQGSQLEGPVHHGGDVLAVGTGGSWSDLIASTIRIQREMNADAQFMVSFSFSLGPQPTGGAAYHEGESFHLC